ncbi:hypothetical protein [Metabacillus fastidiosus]|nr:hypothetical protein [Metabacillus fastidiosus]MED4461478.1 hypothetical protein [Metabacillus fastidiosus]MED4461479.1 hypothetical protein [Metabacillus fastidiosus]MED4533788.1 hypothetical protein [Metabacillus fastidiosus]
MNISLRKAARAAIGANFLILLTFLSLPVLLLTNDASILQPAIDFLNKD